LADLPWSQVRHTKKEKRNDRLRALLTQALVRRRALPLVRPAKNILERNIMIRFNLLAILASALAADAAMIFNNGTPDVSSGTSDNIANRRTADDFSLASAANVASVRFWLVDVPGDFSGSITYVFYQDSAGSLGSLISSATVSGITPVFLNSIPDKKIDRQIGRVDFDLPAPLALATGSYWLELHDGSSLTTLADPNKISVGWAVVSGDPLGNAKGDANPSLPSTNTFDSLAFQLFDNSGNAGNAVPEPATISLIGIGLVALAISRRKLR